MNFCKYIGIRTDVPVIWSDGKIPISIFNPISEEESVTLDVAKIKCVVACDHLAQHVFYRYYTKEMPSSQAEIH